jgi:hypothetical protein
VWDDTAGPNAGDANRRVCVFGEKEVLLDNEDFLSSPEDWTEYTVTIPGVRCG